MIKNVGLQEVEQQLNYYTGRWFPPAAVQWAVSQGKAYIPEFTYFLPKRSMNGDKWRKTNDKDMIRMCEVGKEMVLILEEEDATETRTLTGIVTSIIKASLGTQELK